MSDPSICIFATIKAPLDQVLAFSAFHLNSGADQLFLFFDDPDDPAIVVLENIPRIRCIRCDEAYWEVQTRDAPREKLNLNTKMSKNSRVAIEMARREGFDWIGQIDVDELIFVPGGLKHLLGKVPAEVQVVKFPVLEVIPQMEVDLPAFTSLHAFKVAPVTLPSKKHFLFRWNEYLRYLLHHVGYKMKRHSARLAGSLQAEEFFLKGHEVGKSFARTSAPIRIFYSHFPLPEGSQRLMMSVFPKGSLLHYDFPSYCYWKTKWTNKVLDHEKTSIVERFSPKRMRQFEAFKAIFQRGDEIEIELFFRSHFLLSTRDQRRLRKFGLVTEIKLPEELFAIQSVNAGRSEKHS